jgi:hypothetical protein
MLILLQLRLCVSSMLHSFEYHEDNIHACSPVRCDEVSSRVSTLARLCQPPIPSPLFPAHLISSSLLSLVFSPVDEEIR